MKFNIQRGITLISLVITIIILIILSGISINLVLGENGILNKAVRGVEQSKKAQAEEELNLAITECSVNEEGIINKEKLKEELKKLGVDIESLPEDLPWTVEYKGYNFEIVEDGTVTEINGIIINPKHVELFKGETQQLTCSKVEGANGKIKYESLDEEIATVSDSGLITAVGDSGSTTIIARLEGTEKTATCEVTIVAKLTALTFQETSVSLEEGTTKKLNLNKTPNNMETENIKFVSSDETKVKIDNEGNITGMELTTTPVTVKAIGEKSNITAECSITVVENKHKEMIISADSVINDEIKISINREERYKNEEVTFDYYVNGQKVISTSEESYTIQNFDLTKDLKVYVEAKNYNRSNTLRIESLYESVTTNYNDSRIITTGTWSSTNNESVDHAFDNNMSTYTGSLLNTAAIGCAIGYDFGEPVKVIKTTGKIRMLGYKIQYSDDNVTWMDAITKTSPGSDYGNTFEDNINVEGKHQYWRLYVNGGQQKSEWGAIVWELNFDIAIENYQLEVKE